MKQEDEMLHLLGNNPDFKGPGTHASYGNAYCGGQGSLTCCVSAVQCPECREKCRENGMSNDYIEKMWRDQDAP